MFTGCTDVLCIQHISREKLGFTYKFWVFSLFRLVYHHLDSMLAVDFCYPSQAELDYVLIDLDCNCKVVQGGEEKNFHEQCRFWPFLLNLDKSDSKLCHLDSENERLDI